MPNVISVRMMNVRHLLLQCPSLHEERYTMFNDISHFEDRTGFILPEAVDDTLPVLLGKRADYKLQSKWNFVEHIFNVYMKNMTIKDGLL